MKTLPRIIFFGNPDFSLYPLEALIGKFSVVAVITNPDEPIGREAIFTPPPVKSWIMKHETLNRDAHVQILQPNKLDSDFVFQITSLNPDLFVVAAYGKILPGEILDIPKYGALNIHPSLLPRWRGASPIQYTILNGDTETGVGVILMDEKMDHGPILENSKIKIQNAKLTTSELSQILSKMGAGLIVETIPKWINGEIKPIPQDETKATYSKILKKEDGRIDWSKSADGIERQIRALAPWPGSFTFWKKGKKEVRLELLEASVEKTADLSDDHVSGKVLIKERRLFVKTGQGYLGILRLQPEGKKEMTAKEFLNGYGDINGTILTNN
ncbi:MAG: methionyl-tRNA formyltransferase [Candidatus Sungbacteria bacterium RIFCSPLOWO2_12_FULL_41_11]|uniref:Methionyl-tRNA formyltransferase n=1 Tax=Candidatus Sungbacteria bacterium RIFCSPLOWO2_12_FULL_41_11 TaxID=1802286 RepID=A0A1G2LRZ5_9BACT|nr:MAG: Methionyl-tRNA formyltransferase [Parcubacteria group bacterium GW2011_GWA2_42_14]OHA00083.1 MAG: methionyl-tRNA formyltransferase [Candidatus Sungbacteria bacterium RIFCSPHIGHO2_02_FULL_41_12b]OHA14367.1 MAG: methionyl-tRNA formyltransferase [Candidatus Sungbacteria bacterium RIFCSPLOWO2_12_FULL_41_11]